MLETNIALICYQSYIDATVGSLFKRRPFSLCLKKEAEYSTNTVQSYFTTQMTTILMLGVHVHPFTWGTNWHTNKNKITKIIIIIIIINSNKHMHIFIKRTLKSRKKWILHYFNVFFNKYVHVFVTIYNVFIYVRFKDETYIKLYFCVF